MREIDIERLAVELQGGACVVDVREPDEYAEGHVPGALNIPMGQPAARLDEIDRDRPIYVVCASGNRSSAVTDALTAAGLDATNVAGGTSAWVRSGRPTEK